MQIKINSLPYFLKSPIFGHYLTKSLP